MLYGVEREWGWVRKRLEEEGEQMRGRGRGKGGIELTKIFMSCKLLFCIRMVMEIDLIQPRHSTGVVFRARLPVLPTVSLS
jgi:hypothetical protein